MMLSFNMCCTLYCIPAAHRTRALWMQRRECYFKRKRCHFIHNTMV